MPDFFSTAWVLTGEQLLFFMSLGGMVSFFVSMAVFSELRYRLIGFGYYHVEMFLKAGGSIDLYWLHRKIREGYYDWSKAKYVVDQSKISWRRTRLGGLRPHFKYFEGNPNPLEVKLDDKVMQFAFTSDIVKKRVESDIRKKWVGSLGTDWYMLLAAFGALGACVGVGILFWFVTQTADAQYFQNSMINQRLDNITKSISGGSLLP